jgi:hypothetical protein
MLEVIEQGILSCQPGRGAYCPSIKQLRDGSLIASQDVGSTLGSTDHSLEVLYSSDDGRTWENSVSIPSGAADDKWFYRIPDIAELPDGRLVMRATRFEVANDSEVMNAADEATLLGEALLYWSKDGGRSWSAPQIVPVDLPPEKYTWNGAGGRLLQISESRWMYTMETFRPRGCKTPLDQKAIAVFSSDQGKTWGELAVVADDPEGRFLWWDQMHTLLPDGRIYGLIWTHVRGTLEDLPVHWVMSSDEGRTWSQPQPTNIRGQVCSPIVLSDGRVAAIYNYRHEPQGIRVALNQDWSTFDLENEVVVFDAHAEASTGKPKTDSFLDEHLKIGFGKPSGILLKDGTLMTYFWCTSDGITHTRWARLRY